MWGVGRLHPVSCVLVAPLWLITSRYPAATITRNTQTRAEDARPDTHTYKWKETEKASICHLAAAHKITQAPPANLPDRTFQFDTKAVQECILTPKHTLTHTQSQQGTKGKHAQVNRRAGNPQINEKDLLKYRNSFKILDISGGDFVPSAPITMGLNEYKIIISMYIAVIHKWKPQQKNSRILDRRLKVRFLICYFSDTDSACSISSGGVSRSLEALISKALSSSVF